MANIKSKFYRLIVIIASTLIVALFFADRIIVDSHLASAHKKVHEDLQEISSRLTFNLYNNIQIVKSLPAVFAVNPSLTQQQFALAADGIFDGHNQLRNIAAAPNLIISYMHPMEGNEEAVGVDYRTLPQQIDSVLQAKNSRDIVLAGPLNLVQGGVGIISRTPVYIKDEQESDVFWGIVSSVIDANLLYEASGLFDAGLPLELAIRGKDGLGTSGEVFFGSAALFEQQNITSIISLPNGSWQLAARPSTGWDSLIDGSTTVRLIPPIVGFILFLILYFSTKASMNAATANLKFRNLLVSSPVPYALYNAKFQIIYLNNAFIKTFGYTIKDIPTLDDWWPKAYPDPSYRNHVIDLWSTYIKETRQSLDKIVPPVEVEIRCKNGTSRHILASLAENHSASSEFPVALYDITQRKVAEEKLNRMAHYDVLTQLPNRSLLVDRFHQAIAHSKRSGHPLAVCFLDLDKFKLVNDKYGHETGDQLLQQVAYRIQDTVREEDTVSRQGGDEFALLLGEIESYSACEQFVDRLLNTIDQPYVIDGVSHQISASCGITLYPLDNADLDTLLRHADQAMYQAKQSGRNRHHLFSVEHDEQISEKNHRLTEIEQALVNEEFSLYYQPKVHMQTGEVFGLEALIRWIHPEKGLIPPLEFLPILEGSELELKVGDWVINQALMQLEKWNNMGIKLEVSVNISSHHLQSAYFIKQLEHALADYPAVNSKSLQLEILESSALGDLQAISEIIKTCQDALGVRVALDDFGTGYSSLTHLRNLSANTIKIDQSFIRDILDDPSDYAIIEGVIGLANAFSREIIAEGVESTEHGLMLLIMGCNDAQGYGIAKPIPADDIPDWLVSYKPNQEWLRFSDKPFSIKKNKILLFSLITNSWLSRFTRNILTEPDDITRWPNLKIKQGLGYLWLTREKQGSLFEKETLIKLEQARKECLILAHSIQLKYLDGKIESAREGLSELQVAADEMSAVLRQREESSQTNDAQIMGLT